MIQIYEHKSDNKRKAIVRWIDSVGNDGLNVRIVHMLPIEREGNKKYLCLKCRCLTKLGETRKTTFAVKFEKVEEAEEFEMWWYKLNGEIYQWVQESKRKEEKYEQLPMDNVVNVGDDNVESYFKNKL